MFKKLQALTTTKRFVIFTMGFVFVLIAAQIIVATSFMVVFPHPSQSLLTLLEASYADFLKYVAFIYFIAALALNYLIEKRNMETNNV